MKERIKKLSASLLAAMMIVTYMPAMAFADDTTATEPTGTEPVATEPATTEPATTEPAATEPAATEPAATEPAAAAAATVTTDDTTAPIEYASFAEAFNATNTTNNEKKHAVITLQADAKWDGVNAVAIPLTVKLNGHKITGTYSITADAQDASYTGFCRQDSSDAIVFVEHKAGDPVYTWAQRQNGAWYVSGVTTTCDNCGTKTVTVDASKTTPTNAPAAGGKETYKYEENGKVLATKEVEGGAVAVYTNPQVTIVQVNGVNQHKDGLPVVKATVNDSTISDDIEAKTTVAAATDKELAAKDVKVYDEAGNEITKPANGFKAVEEATCIAEGTAIYKVVVTAPDNTNFTVFVKDSQAAAKTGHVEGKLNGVRFLKKNTFTSQAAAEADQQYANKVGNLETVKNGSSTEYVFWTYESTVQSVKSALTLSPDYVHSDGSLTYVPVYSCLFEKTNVVVGKPVTVKPFADAATSAEFADGKHSKCEQWLYPNTTITYEYYQNDGDTVKSKETDTVSVAAIAKDAAAYSHKDDGTKYDVQTQPTCSAPGKAKVKCAICGQADNNTVVDIPKLADTFGAFTGTAVTASQLDSVKFNGDNRAATLNADKTEATLAATCEHDGGVYQYCTGENNGKVGHWVLKSELKATGHTLDTRIVSGQWSKDTDVVYNASTDYKYTADQSCSNANCDKGAHYFSVTYHSAKSGVDTDSDKYGTIEIVDEKQGADCQTQAKTVYTVKGLTDRTGKAITKEFKKGAATVGDHKYEATSFNWSKDFEAATVTAKCTVKGCGKADLTQKATVTKATDASGLTTYTAKYGDKSEAKKVYTLKDAKVSYDASKITDGNLVEGIDGAAPQTPEVKVELNGTVIDNKNLKEVWNYDAATKEVKLTVEWAASVTAEGVDAKTADKASAKTIKVAAKKAIAPADVTTTVKDGGKAATATSTGYYNRDYNPDKAFTVSAAVKNLKSATVKYAVSDEFFNVSVNDAAEKLEAQKEIEALDYSLDKVELKDAEDSYVYAQISADGYTTYTAYLANIEIDPMSVDAYCDGATFTEGENPDINIVFKSGNKIVNIDKSLVKVVSAGGKALNELKPGKYYILVTADNYDVDSSSAQVTVLAKDGKSAEEKTAEEAKARQAAVEAANAAEDADKAAADAAKVAEEKAAAADKAMAEAKTDEEKAAAAKLADEAAEAAKTAAEKAAAAKDANDKSVDAAKAAYGADSAQYKDAKAKADAAAAAATKAAEAKKAADTKSADYKKANGIGVEKKANPMKVKAKTIKAKKAKKMTFKKAKAFKVSKAQGKVTFKKVKGNKKIVVKKNGKVIVKKGLKKGKTYKVKVKVRAAGNKNYKAKTKTVTLKVKVR